jgi:pimeloyl-ACP methyl ester carboxylesterase
MKRTRWTAVLAAVLAATAGLAVAPGASAGTTQHADGDVTQFHRPTDVQPGRPGHPGALHRALGQAGNGRDRRQVRHHGHGQPLLRPRHADRLRPPASWLPRSAGTDRESFNRMVTLSNDLARRCAPSNADVLPYASAANAARDMDVIRAALEAPKLSFLGYSQGSYLGAQYMQRFPQRAGRIVLDSAIDPDQPGVTILSDPMVAARREAALREWAALAAQHDDLLHLGTTTERVLSTVHRVYLAAAATPLRVGPYLVDDAVIPGIIVNLLTDDSEEGALELAATVQVLVQAADTGSAEPTEALATSLAGQLTAGTPFCAAQRPPYSAATRRYRATSRRIGATSRHGAPRHPCSARWAATSRRARSGRTLHRSARSGSATAYRRWSSRPPATSTQSSSLARPCTKTSAAPA